MQRITVSPGATERHQPKKNLKRKIMLSSALDFLQYLILLLSTDHLFFWTDIFHAWALQGYTRYLWDVESVLHEILGFFYQYWYMSDNIISPLNLFTSTINLRFYSHQQPHFSATGRHWALLGATSQKNGLSPLVFADLLHFVSFASFSRITFCSQPIFSLFGLLQPPVSQGRHSATARCVCLVFHFP